MEKDKKHKMPLKDRIIVWFWLLSFPVSFLVGMAYGAVVTILDGCAFWDAFFYSIYCGLVCLWVVLVIAAIRFTVFTKWGREKLREDGVRRSIKSAERNARIWGGKSHFWEILDGEDRYS